jgi:hypothetical protein
VNKHYLATSWCEQPFQIDPVLLSITDWPNAVLYSLPLEKRRYCWMHGVSNLLSNAIKHLYQFLPTNSPIRTAVKQCIQQCKPKWKPKSAIVPKEMKLFYAKHLDVSFIGLFQTFKHPVQLQWPGYVDGYTLTFNQMVDMFIDAIRVYKEFAYTPWPTSMDVMVLEQARSVVLSIYAAHQWTPEITTHYMTSHAIEFVKLDGTAYFTLQEGVEHANYVDKQDIECTFKGTSIATTGRNRWQQLLDHQQLQHHLIVMGKAHSISVQSM